MCESLLVAARRLAHLASDALLEEVTTHTSMALRKNQGFTGRVPELEAIMAYIRGSSRLPFVVCGNSGSGKTALMAKAALMCCEIREYFMIVRFLGTSMRSSSAAELMRNLCIHLGRIYGQSNANVPFNYSSLKSKRERERERERVCVCECNVFLYLCCVFGEADVMLRRREKILGRC